MNYYEHSRNSKNISKINIFGKLKHPKKNKCECKRTLPNPILSNNNKWNEIKYSNIKYYECPKCNTIYLNMNYSWCKVSYHDKQIWKFEIKKSNSKEITNLKNKCKNEYIQHCKMFDPNYYYELIGSNKRLTEDEEDDYIHRVAESIKYKSYGNNN
jgi:hypothetical protein